ncbi:MAG: UDP-N-acetylglucosamine 4,6-dehydratase (inverting) [Myxococcota bacterium]|nr:UDP-N-acetylglucosamine 4,6-dehydratase (inverting) [Myxococcales bacterium]
MSSRLGHVLITGGTGSFGRAFVASVLERGLADVVRIYSRDEWKQGEMAAQFQHDARLRFLLGDVRDRERLARAMDGVDVVVHAAALKQVPSCEYNPAEAVRTNVDGAQNVIDAAITAGVARTVALSTDKAVNPINIYGATKLCAEKLFAQGGVYAGNRPSRFACVRYGNVVGTRGSVIPLFVEQAKSGVVTITDPKMTRFWISLEQAVEFVLDAIENMQGGEIFVPKIPSMRIVDLARAIAPDAVLKCVGRRPGEKLHELLLSAEESPLVREHRHHYVIGGKHRNAGRAVAEGFTYASHTNDQWIGVDHIRALVDRWRGSDHARVAATGSGASTAPIATS